MLADVTKSNNFFGVHLFEPKDEFDTRPPVGSVGCIAEVRDVQEMPDGKSNILTNGVIRYRLVDYVDTEKPYLVGEVEFFEDGGGKPSSAAKDRRRGIRTFRTHCASRF
jgi:Lon protease-like protein